MEYLVLNQVGGEHRVVENAAYCSDRRNKKTNVFYNKQFQEKKMENEMIKLSDGYSVSKDVYECYRQIVVTSLLQINSGNAYTLKKILGRDIWNELDNGERRLMGRCVAHMSVHDILPLSIVASKHEYPIRYQLK